MQPEPNRHRLNPTRPSLTHKRTVCGFELYVSVSFYDDDPDRDRPGEIFAVVGKNGSTIANMVDGIAVLMSMALQYGVPWAKIRDKFLNYRFDQNGDPQHKSLLDGLVQMVDHLIGTRQKMIGYDESRPEPRKPDFVVRCELLGSILSIWTDRPPAEPIEKIVTNDSAVYLLQKDMQ